MIKNKYIFNKYSLIIIANIFFLIISYHLQLFANALSADFIPGDSYTYIKAAKRLFVDLKLSPVRPYGYSMIIGIPYLFSISATQEVLLIWSYFINFVLWNLTILYIFKSVKIFAGKTFAFTAALAFVLCVAHIAQVAALMTETLATFIIALFGYLMLKYHYLKSYFNLSLSVGLLILLVLIKPGMFYLAILFSIIFIMLLVKKRVVPSLKLISPIIIAVLMLLVQIMSNYMAYGNFTNSYTDKYTWYTYLGAESNAESLNKTFLEVRDARRKIINPMSPPEYYELAKNDLSEQLKINPNLILINFLSNIKDNIVVGNIRISGADDYKNDPYFNYKRYYLYLISKFQNILLSVLGLTVALFAILKKPSLFLFYSAMLISYIIFTSGISFWEGDRFNTVFYPVVILICGYAYIEFFGIKKFITKDNLIS